MRLRLARTLRLEGPALDERERQEARPNRLGHTRHGQAARFAGPRDPDLQDVCRSKRRVPVTRDQDPVGDEALELIGRDAGPGRELGGRELLGLLARRWGEAAQHLALIVVPEAPARPADPTGQSDERRSDSRIRLSESRFSATAALTREAASGARSFDTAEAASSSTPLRSLVPPSIGSSR